MQTKLQKKEDTGWIAVKIGIQYRILNGMCTVAIFFNGQYILQGGKYTVIGTLPEYASPKIIIEFCPHLTGGYGIGTRGVIGADGVIQIYVSSTINTAGATVTYPI